MFASLAREDLQRDSDQSSVPQAGWSTRTEMYVRSTYLHACIQLSCSTSSSSTSSLSPPALAPAIHNSPARQLRELHRPTSSSHRLGLTAGQQRSTETKHWLEDWLQDLCSCLQYMYSPTPKTSQACLNPSHSLRGL